MLILLLLLFTFLSPSFTSVDSFNFSFPSFDSDSCTNGGNLICSDSATASNGTLNVTSDHQQQQPRDPPPINQIGRVLYKYPVIGWPAYICTTFSIRILTDPNSEGAGDGMAFVLTQDAAPSPANSFGSFLGIFDQSTQGVVHQLAIEFDTYKNEFDPDDNHIAIDTVSVQSPVAVKSLNSTGINLKSGRKITVRVEYDGWTKNLQIYVGYNGDPLVSFLNHTMMLQHTVPSSVYVGFTAATGTLSETHQVLAWNFTSIELPNKSLGPGNNLGVKVAVPVISGLLFLAILALPFVLRALRKQKERLARKVDIEMMIAAANGPRLFSYKKLSKATRNFSKDNLLGIGGFGSVYKGVMSKPPTTIAVKKINATSKQGEKEYLAEICTISRLRHKNLLQLQGWCHDHDQLLLVYEYMPNGSLDRFIGKDNTFLDWASRYKVLLGLASALVYLHEECGNPVVHRDVKPNNVMLDSKYNAHLGDFGLARLLQNEASVTTRIAGTPGYLAPEVSFTGKATPESDVYSFGMVVLEVVCGKRTKGIMDENSLVDSVWRLYEKGVDALIDCVDRLLEGKFDEEEVKRSLVVGLACLHPDFMLRPRMRKVVQVFMNPNEPPLNLPESRPNFVCLSFNSSTITSTITDLGSSKVDGGGSMETLPDETTVQYGLCHV
ncbi:probable L-type lectin-domain containing receptor kinase S.5 [Camellia sinensis]|uniref:probable L-type lectin-domain containing receptor kinase S.5 n=1 Tax=Camellia sinensis TaxID=4442 RepID=UPI001035A71F|nr:probable L-type lectin-domain containing receptor kinase S.5 [Camellia sinensis]